MFLFLEGKNYAQSAESHFGRGTFFFVQAEETRFFSSAALLRREGGALGLGGEFPEGKIQIQTHMTCAAFWKDGWWMIQNKKCVFFWKNAFKFYLHLSGVILSEKKPLWWRMWWCGSQTYLTVSTIWIVDLLVRKINPPSFGLLLRAVINNET